MRAGILAIGDELVLGSKVDTNSAWLSRELAAAGVLVSRCTVVGDAAAELLACMGEAAAGGGLLICTGGLGPTADDRTRSVAAEAAGRGLEFRDDAWAQIVAMFRAFGRKTESEVPPSNRRQAYLPVGAALLENRWGTAPGFRMRIRDAELVALPGVPREMQEMFKAHVLPSLKAAGRAPLVTHQMQVLGLREAALGEQLEHLMEEHQATQVGLTASRGQLTLRLNGFDREDLERTRDEIRELLGPHLIYEGEHSLAEEVGRRCIEQEISLALAESCTGGLLGGALTQVPGISAVLRAGYVTYSNAAKIRDLEVPPELIDQCGAVSLEVAEAMALGAARRGGARAGVSITGIAGPDGGTPDKPVGTVCIGVCMDGTTQAERLQLANLGRELVRDWSVRQALAALLRSLPEG